MCWYCENGLPVRVRAIVDKLKDEHPGAESGPGHIVFSDYNLGDDNIRWCLDLIADIRSGKERGYERAAEDIDADEKALIALLAIPEAERCPPGSDEI